MNSTVISASNVKIIPGWILDVLLGTNAIFGELLTIFGIIGNIINIIIFYKLGFTDTVNITLTFLALTDLGALVTLQAFNVLVNPWFLQLDVNIIPLDIAVMVSFYPHNYFIRVCGFITAFASVERCLCVVFPLKVKRWVTTKVVVVTNVTIYFITLFNEFPAYYTGYIGWKKISPGNNKTYLGIVFRSVSKSMYDVSYLITDLFLPYATFIVIIVSTVILSFKLNHRAKWVKTLSSVNKRDKNISQSEKRVIRMLTTISITFIVCLMPQSAILSAVSLVPGLGLYGKYFDIALVCYNVAYYTESINSSITIVVYYSMSSNYKKTLQQMFACFKWS
ncbi:lysophosphatidic acid receptor 4-like [Physella acuta]|uniref:lysophosphatidic acid receptor 4-like n=1 Tax=Physella acuta TaxID=109671 RepID=UPI0027DD3014|nr:lysophosphatidic acid receptor 4-like [Physella acuta]